MVFGPGLIVMEADNDAGAVSTYIQAGAQYGTHLLWLLVLLLPITYFIQEMVVRLGIATGQGHAAMIYSRFGKWWGLFSLVDLQLLNFLTLVTEFAAIALALQHLNISPLVGVPIAACALTLLVLTGSYRRWERIVVFLCLLDLAWFAFAFYSRPAAGEVAPKRLRALDSGRRVHGESRFSGGGNRRHYHRTVAVVLSTELHADKRLRFADLKWARLDTLIGAAFAIIVAGCMMITGNAALHRGFSFTDPAQMAVDLGKVFGPWFRTGLLLLMINAATLGTTAISLSSAWAYGEVKGWPHSLQKSIRDAPGSTASMSCVWPRRPAWC